jgi:2-polyprenyl-3-methyl-5-hydroxy-6-metoxy-1,4-benzoquinol methylase
LWASWLKQAGLNRSAAICDVGCGSGDWLVNLQDQGFTNLAGADAFIPSSNVRHGIPIYKASPNEVPGQYDFVWANHSFEHMPDPHVSLEALAALVRPAGTLMLRMPVAGCWAWRHYGADWVSLDAPRHLHLLTAAALDTLATAHRLTVYEVRYDSTAEQFWRSEQYRQDISLFDERSYLVNPAASMFTSGQMDRWARQAQQLNAENDGDTAAFFLHHTTQE